MKIAMVAVKYPEDKMSLEKLGTVQDSISEAHDKVTTVGTQVRLAKCSKKPGYLKSLEGDHTPRSLACTTFVPTYFNTYFTFQ